MLEKEQIYLIGSALNETTRYYIPFSENLPGLRPMGFVNSLFVNERKRALENLRLISYPSYSREYGLSAWNARVGYCGELAIAAGCLSEYLGNIPTGENLYLSIFRIGNYNDDCHVFFILHQDSELHRQYTLGGSRVLANDFRNLPKCLPPNSVIVDPWIRAVNFLDDIEEHLKSVQIYKVNHYYAEDIKIKTHEISFELGSKYGTLVPSSLREILLIYDACFKSLQKQNFHSTINSQFKEIKKYYKQRIQSWNEDVEKFKSLRNFFSTLGNRQSRYLPLSFDYKSGSFHKAIFYLDACKKMGKFPIDKFPRLLISILRMTVLIRHKQAPDILSENNLLKTCTGSALFDKSIIHGTPYLFEQWPNMSLDFIRDFVMGFANETMRYRALCLYLHQENIEQFIESGEHLNPLSQPGIFSFSQGYQKYKNPRKDLSCLYLPHYHQYCSAQLNEVINISGDGVIGRFR